ncbi:MAG: Rieske 2Fe-2S domain-containing protein [Alphaproteobacteria bacterium]
MNYLRNCWYVAAASHELGKSLLARTLLEQPVVLYRKQDGTAVALEDRCSHRFYPLSAGELKADSIVCGYHGMEFDCAGRCVRVPGQKNVPRGADIKAYPIAEKWRFVWLWMGDPALADESKIPEIWRNNHPEWDVVCGDCIPVKGNYRLVADNLLDPSHVSFLHKSTLGTADVADIPQDTEQFGHNVRVTRWILDRAPAPVYARLGGFKGNVDRWQIITFTPPALVEVDMGSCVAGSGAPQGDRSQGIELHAFNLVTPSARDTAYYFWTHVRNFSLGDADVSKTVRQQFITAFTEDVMAIEGVQAGFAKFPDKRPVNISADGGGIRARRILDDLIAAERTGSSTKAAE